MTQTMEAINEYTFASLQNPNSSDLLNEKYSLENYFHAPLPYHIQAECDWMNSPSPSAVSTPEGSPSTPSPHLSSASLSMPNNNVFPSHWPTGPTSSDPTQSIKDIQRLTDAKSRRRQQNRESQRAFRERKNRHIEQLEQALADLQHRHEKLLQCFVGLTAKVSGSNLDGNSNNNNMMGDMSFLSESQMPTMQRMQTFSAYSGNRFSNVGALDKRDSGLSGDESLC